jgi:hypothetical protein
MLTGRDSDNGMGDLVAKVSLGSLLHLSENHGADFLGSLERKKVRSNI